MDAKNALIIVTLVTVSIGACNMMEPRPTLNESAVQLTTSGASEPKFACLNDTINHSFLHANLNMKFSASKGTFIGTKNGQIILTDKIRIEPTNDTIYNRTYSIYKYADGSLGYRINSYIDDRHFEFTHKSINGLSCMMVLPIIDGQRAHNMNTYYIFDTVNKNIVKLKFNVINENHDIALHQPLHEIQILDSLLSIKSIFLSSNLRDNTIGWIGTANFNKINGKYDYHFDQKYIPYSEATDCLLDFARYMQTFNVKSQDIYRASHKSSSDMYIPLFIYRTKLKYFPINGNERVPNFNF